MAFQLPVGSQLSQAFIKIADECNRLDTIPAFDQGAAILRTLEEMQNRMQEMQRQMQEMQRQMQEMQKQMSDVEQKIDKGFDDLDKKNVISNNNSIARTQNSMISFADRELSGLVDINTGEDIPDFPNTATMITRMSSPAINRVLSALGLKTTGNLDQRRIRMSAAIGLKIGGV
ncbi:uncharacterized protein EAF02_000542 [Botrytis sinoallii]|uniref:uncharacterized protein n=1 Tax=Botrytis sinoallii TaxID=1463999 RepID=UPI001901BC97|nr:uncharacterized protein EAF02_000542 [Botrytis sinoallii]KAF7893004.1 hypothetical protein EAF02_000542 [Botrytis sinoallii]